MLPLIEISHPSLLLLLLLLQCRALAGPQEREQSLSGWLDGLLQMPPAWPHVALTHTPCSAERSAERPWSRRL